MELQQYTVWKLIDEFSFDEFEGGERFSHKLARTGNWTPGYTKDVIDEYKRFLFLCATQTEVLAPPIFVDMAWMMHIEEYPESFRQLTLLIPHHLIKRSNVLIPTFRQRYMTDNGPWFFNNYINTQKIYDKNFGTWPPANVWGSYEEEMYDYKPAHIDMGKNMNFQLDYRWICALFLLAGFLLFLMYRQPVIIALGGIAAIVYYFFHPSAQLAYDTERDGKGYRHALRADEPTL